MEKYHLIGEYNHHQIYYDNKEQMILKKGMTEFEEVEGLEKDMMLTKFGGLKGIELIINKYKKEEK